MTYSRRLFIHTLMGGLLTLPLHRTLLSQTFAADTLASSSKDAELILSSLADKGIFFNDDLPGPFMHAKRGETFSIKVTNRLTFPTALHLRGIRPDTKEALASLSPPLIAPNETAILKFTPPDSGLFLYEADARLGGPAANISALSGLLLVSNPDAPARPDETEMFLTLHDMRNSKIATSEASPYINGHALPELHTLPAGSRVRLRIANLSNSQVYYVNFKDLSPIVIAIDGQPCPVFEPVRQTIPLGPHARFEIVCTLPNSPKASVMLIDKTPRPLITFTTTPATTTAKAKDVLPLPPNKALPEEIQLGKAFKLDLTLQVDPQSKGSINGRAGRIDGPPLFEVKKGQAVSLGLINKSNQRISIHFHGHVVRQLHILDDGWEPYWRDTLLIQPGQTVRCAFIAEQLGDWVIEATDPKITQNGLWGFFHIT